jgi:hypothetical protein
MELTLAELEDAINYWRARSPAQGDALVLAPQVKALAEIYALMIVHRMPRVQVPLLSPAARDALAGWRSQ